MAVPARSDSPLATRAPRTPAANDGFGSLMAMGGPRKKKKPVLVLADDELQKAHAAIAMGGAQIMEEALVGEEDTAHRQPASLLGLAPMAADDCAREDKASYPPIPDASTWQDAEEDMPGTPELVTPDAGELEPVEEEPAWEEEEEIPDQASNLEHLLRPASAAPAKAPENDESVIPSIEEQLKRMRALPNAQDVQKTADQLADQSIAPEPAVPEIAAQVEPAETPQEKPEEASKPATMRRAGPMERLDEFPLGAKGFSFSEQPNAGEPVKAPPIAAPSPAIAAEEPLELEMFAEPAAPPESSDIDFGDAEEDGPDLSWMEPEAPREMHIAGGEHSKLRAQLVHEEEELEEALLVPSIWQRIRNWFASLRARF